MRFLGHREIMQRGCDYCLDKQVIHNAKSGYNVTCCHYEECPYHELDNVKIYGEYIQKTNTSGLAKALAELAKLVLRE